MSSIPLLDTHQHLLMTDRWPYSWTRGFTPLENRRFGYVEHCIECFGWDRVMWGGDWPVCLLNASLKSWADATREIVAREDESNQRKLFHENAERIYKVTLGGYSSKGLVG